MSKATDERNRMLARIRIMEESYGVKLIPEQSSGWKRIYIINPNTGTQERMLFADKSWVGLAEKVDAVYWGIRLGRNEYF